MTEEAAVPRRWLEVVAWSPSAPDDPLLSEGLLALGGRAVEERDGRFLTHVAEPSDLVAWRAEAAAVLQGCTGLHDLRIETAWRPQEDWAELWKRGLGPRRVGRRLLVTPSWCDPGAGPDDLVVVIDPGMAFGTAEHGTTRGCLRLMEGLVEPGTRVLDVGSGSGILAVAAALLGATEVVAVEGDPLAVEQALENLVRNRVDNRVDLLEAWADPADLGRLGPAAGIVSNIEPSVLTGLLPGFRAALRPAGWLVLGGILAGEWEAQAGEAARHGFVLQSEDGDGDWRSGAFRAPASAAR